MKRLSYSRIIAIGFFIMIVLGTVFLSLPISSATGEWTRFSDAFFTAVSAQCVTGLVVVNTAAHWSLFGQIVILILIQTGGLGFISIGVFLTMMMKRKLTLSQRSLFQESMNTLELSGTTKLTKKIMAGVFVCEAIGAVILTVRFLKTESALKAVYYGIFHSVSAFCNAGFAILPKESLTGYTDDITVNVTVMALILIGGLGFIVWDDIWTNRLKVKKYRLHTKIVLASSVVLVLGGAVLLFISERGTLMHEMGLKEQITAAFFGSVTARTAGFNSVAVGAMSQAGKLVTIILMFIGGNPGSTAGGVKTTTIVVICMFLISNFRRSEPNIFGKRLENDSIRKAATVFATNLLLIITAVIIITMLMPLDLTDVVFEAVSAISTVGMSTGITAQLNEPCRFVIAMLMYLGRVGSMTFAVSFFEKKKKITIGYMPEKISIG